jgi:hypothetical protein
VLWVRYPNQARWCVYILDIQLQESIGRGGVQHGLNTYTTDLESPRQLQDYTTFNTPPQS